MTPQEQERQPTEAQTPYEGRLAKIPTLGFQTRRKRYSGSQAWRKTVTQHEPEPWQAARLALQARICALD
jgi:hypothetical protein